MKNEKNNSKSMGCEEKSAHDVIDRDRIFISSGIIQFGERLRHAMNGISNSELARRAGLSEATIRKYLKGNTFPGIDSVALVAEACNVSLVWLVSGIELKDDSHSSLVRKSSTDLKGVFGALSEEQRASLAAVIVEHGVNGILKAVLPENSIGEFSNMSNKERERVMRIYRQLKEGDSAAGKTTEGGNLADGNKMTG